MAHWQVTGLTHRSQSTYRQHEDKSRQFGRSLYQQIRMLRKNIDASELGGLKPEDIRLGTRQKATHYILSC